jgi:hypothetical protein
MYSWLSSVNNLLEKLNDRAETVSGETVTTDMELWAFIAAVTGINWIPLIKD